MENQRRPPRDNIYLGAFFGLVLPIAVGILFWVFAFSDRYSISDYWNILFEQRQMAAILSLSLLINGFLFFYFNNNRRFDMARGVLGATLFYGLLIIIFKFF